MGFFGQISFAQNLEIVDIDLSVESINNAKLPFDAPFYFKLNKPENIVSIII